MSDTRPLMHAAGRRCLDQITDDKGSNFFLFIDRPTLAAGDPLEVEWVNGKRSAVKLTD